MNDQDFILLMEEYFDGTISPEGRAALRNEMLSTPARRALFESQARQHIRIHAQTSPIDFTESQRIAVSVMDIVDQQHRPATFADIMKEQKLHQQLGAIREGLFAPRGSGEHRYARFVLKRISWPLTVAIAVNALLIWVVFSITPRILNSDTSFTDAVSIVIRTPEPDATLEPVAPTPSTQPDTTPDAHTQHPTAPVDPTTPLIAMLGPSSAGDAATGGEPATVSPDAPTAPPNAPSLPTGLPRLSTGLPSILIGRDPTNRIGIIKQIPRGTETERAVAGSLRWLKTHQQPDGSWAGQDPAAMTGLALLAYLAHGETPGSPDYGPTVRRALEYLILKQDSSGNFSKNVYSHAIATYAMAEAFTLTRIMSIRTSMERGAAVIINGQQQSGGFDYNYSKGARFDTSVSGWQIQAMKAAFIAGSDQPGLKDALQKSIRFLQTLSFARDGSGFVYSGETTSPPAGGAKWTMTGVGTLCLQLLGAGAAPQARQGLKLLSDLPFDWPRDAKPSVYGFYYVTQAKFQAGNHAAWDRWNRQMQQTLLRAQQPDGRWEGGDYDQGSHVYTTTICTLMLEVYYRYLPTLQKVPNEATPINVAAGEVEIDVR